VILTLFQLCRAISKNSVILAAFVPSVKSVSSVAQPILVAAMDQFSRRIIGFGMQAAAVDGVALCRMFNQAVSGQGLPLRLSFDHDPLIQFQRWQANLRVLDIQPVQTVPLVPRSHPFVERLVGTVRRDTWIIWSFGTPLIWKESSSCIVDIITVCSNCQSPLERGFAM
jgi:hypothetical protein